jgi:1-acyl-sn-glycerol-3-phosphate acyltransferase
MSDPLRPDASPYPFAARFVVPAIRWIALALGVLLYRLRWRGRRLVPRGRAFVLAPNHQSYFDPPLIGAPLWGRLFSYMANERYFAVPVVGWILRNAAVIPVNLEARFDRRAYKRSLEMLAHSLGMIVFIEGTRSADGRMGQAQTGAARMALTTGASLVPVAITGAYEVWPRDRKRPRPWGRILIKYYRPIPVEKCADRGDLSARAQELTERVARLLDRRVRAYYRWSARRAEPSRSPRP